ncbi:cache domain-containing sensor histidine kinase [Halostella salina]|uniref:cache domain-containing sensor histidine kinase n=1 Tax=Halostella salina TaxID=1547897 RepID=UPI000EF76738|nr:ATP-binding protein [Halostella salina]
MRLRTKFLLVFFVLSLLLTGILALEFQSHRERVIDRAQADAEADAAVTATQLDERIEMGQQTLATAAEHPAIARHGSPAQTDRTDALVAQTDFDGVSVVNGTGALVAIGGVDSDARNRVVGSDFSDRGYVRRALAGEQYVSAPFQAATGNEIVVLSVPIRENGSVVGTLNAAIHLSNASFFASLPVADEETSVVVAADDRTLYRSSRMSGEFVVGHTTMETTGWNVSVGRDRATVLSDVRRLLYGQFLPTGVAFFLLFAFVAWLYRKDIRQVEKLLDGVGALERREYDRTVDLSGSAEWEQLDSAFGRLSNTLAERETMLLVLNRVLRHNLRNSLTVILGRATLIEDETDDEGTRRSAAEIRAAAEELGALSEKARMTEDLLTPAVETDHDPVDLSELARRVVGAYRLAGTDAEFHLTAPSSAPVRAGPEVERAVEELIDNVVEHAGDRPRIDLVVEREAETTTLRVADDGPGIPPDEQAILLGERRISQLHHSGGLGLWLVDWITNRYDGDLDIGCDDGTVVTLQFENAQL